MKSLLVSTTALAAGLALAAPAFAQTTTPGGSMEGWRMPYERGFWGHAGLSLGRAEVDVNCPAGATCDDKSDFWRIYAGGRFNNSFGLEVGGLRFGDFGQGGAESDGYGVDFALIAGLPIGANSAVFAKAGALYARTETAGVGSQQGWGPRYGVGGQIGLTPTWAIRADWDRYEVKFAGGNREDVDTLTLGVQYTFR